MIAASNNTRIVTKPLMSFFFHDPLLKSRHLVLAAFFSLWVQLATETAIKARVPAKARGRITDEESHTPPSVTILDGPVSIALRAGLVYHDLHGQ